MSGCYQPETLEELRALIASDPRTPQDLGGVLAREDAYSICGFPGDCLVTRALENAKENEPISDISVLPSPRSLQRANVSYTGPDGERYEQPLSALLNTVAVRFDLEGLSPASGICYRSKQDCLDLLDTMIAERETENAHETRSMQQ